MKNMERNSLTSQILKLINALPIKIIFYFVLIVFTSLLATVSEILTLSTIQPILQNMMGSENSDSGIIFTVFPKLQITQTLLLSVALASVVFSTFFRLALVWMNINFTNKVSHYLSGLLMRSLLEKDILFYKEQSSSEIISAFAVKITNVSSTVLAITNLITSSIIILGMTIAVVLIYTSITIPALVMTVLFYVIVLTIVRKKIHNNGVLIAKIQSSLISIAQGAIGSIRDVILNQRSAPFVSSYLENLTVLNHAAAVNTFLNQSPRFVFEALFMICILIITMATQNLDSGTSIISIIAVLALAAQRLIPLMQQAFSAMANIYAANQAIKDVFSFIDFTLLEHKTDSKFNKEPIKNIKINNISFSYIKDQPLLKNISFEVSAGDFFVIMGPTGSGKSSLLDTIFDLIKPSKGNIEINNNRNMDSNPLNFLGKVGFVAQKIFILNDSIQANIAFSLDGKVINKQRIMQCCRDVLFIDESDIDGFLNRQCGENGSKLSGGQIQRLALARALYQDPDILVLDEFGSGLDKDTLTSVIKNLKTKYSSKIIIFVTHSELVFKEATKHFILGNNNS